MNHYLHRVFTLLLPISVVATLLALFYFQNKYGYGISQTFPLSMLTGFMIGGAISLFLALLTSTKKAPLRRDLSKRRNKEQAIPSSVAPIITQVTEVRGTSLTKKPKSSSKKERLMLLMDRELVFHLALQSIQSQAIGTVIESKNKEGKISMQSQGERITIAITALTRHTAQIILKSTHTSNKIAKIIASIKRTEYSLLDYQASLNPKHSL
ncbi:MAG: hypothetical protein Q9M36_03485 [Sulfurovum sp.]|nr:hypothetical protein [Sulfurovum sp.]